MAESNITPDPTETTTIDLTKEEAMDTSIATIDLTREGVENKTNTEPNQNIRQTGGSSKIGHAIRKCEKFFNSVLELSARGTVTKVKHENIRSMIQQFVNGEVDAGKLTTVLMEDVDPKPYGRLESFLTEHMPYFRLGLFSKKCVINGIDPPQKDVVLKHFREKRLSQIPMGPSTSQTDQVGGSAIPTNSNQNTTTVNVDKPKGVKRRAESTNEMIPIEKKSINEVIDLEESTPSTYQLSSSYKVRAHVRRIMDQSEKRICLYRHQYSKPRKQIVGDHKQNLTLDEELTILSDTETERVSISDDTSSHNKAELASNSATKPAITKGHSL